MELGGDAGAEPRPVRARLAVHVEDHPLDYGSFEGNIPKGEYGGGAVIVWDEGSWEPDGDPAAGMKKGHMRFELKGEKLDGAWHLVRLKRRGQGKARQLAADQVRRQLRPAATAICWRRRRNR